MSLVGAMTPLGEVASTGRHYWLRAAFAYTLGGSISAAMVGTALGLIGWGLNMPALGASVFLLVSAMGLCLAFREFGLLHFSLPQRLRQTEKAWVHDFGFVAAASMWGIDVGLGFATYIHTGGFWFLVATAVAVADPMFGAHVFLAYWLGRTLPVWLGIPLRGCDNSMDDLLTAIDAQDPVLHTVAGYGLLWASAVSLGFAILTFT